jgi:hypothetical protein
MDHPKSSCMAPGNSALQESHVSLLKQPLLFPLHSLLSFSEALVNDIVIFVLLFKWQWRWLSLAHTLCMSRCLLQYPWCLVQCLAHSSRYSRSNEARPLGFLNQALSSALGNLLNSSIYQSPYFKMVLAHGDVLSIKLINNWNELKPKSFTIQCSMNSIIPVKKVHTVILTFLGL